MNILPSLLVLIGFLAGILIYRSMDSAIVSENESGGRSLPIHQEAIIAKNDIYDIDSLIEELYNILTDKEAVNNPEKRKRVCKIVGQLRAMCCIYYSDWDAFKCIMGYPEYPMMYPSDTEAGENDFDTIFKMFSKSGLFIKIEGRKQKIVDITNKLNDGVNIMEKDEFEKCLKEYESLLREDGYTEAEVDKLNNNYVYWRWECEKMSNRVDSPVHGQLANHPEDERIGWSDLVGSESERKDFR